jgi:hypothetical protein
MDDIVAVRNISDRFHSLYPSSYQVLRRRVEIASTSWASCALWGLCLIALVVLRRALVDVRSGSGST